MLAAAHELSALREGQLDVLAQATAVVRVLDAGVAEGLEDRCDLANALHGGELIGAEEARPAAVLGALRAGGPGLAGRALRRALSVGRERRPERPRAAGVVQWGEVHNGVLAERAVAVTARFGEVGVIVTVIAVCGANANKVAGRLDCSLDQKHCQ